MMLNPALVDRQNVLGPGGPAPVRKRNSVRRTLSIDTIFPEGMSGPQDMLAICRDIRTGDQLDDIKVLDEDRLHLTASRDRTILSADAGKHREAEMKRLVGLKAGGQLRGANAEINPGMKQGGSPFHLLLDDLAVATLTAGWLWLEWQGEPVDAGRPVVMDNRQRFSMQNACHGFKTGSSSLTPEGYAREDNQHHRRVPSLVHPDDPKGWHELPDRGPVCSRRARWIDVWMREDGKMGVEAGFQDSGMLPDGTRGAVHEYRLVLSADAETLEILALNAEPRILPYVECPGAVMRIQSLKGSRIPELRTDVVQHLKGTNGCTHLNDVLRGLADVSVLAKAL